MVFVDRDGRTEIDRRQRHEDERLQRADDEAEHLNRQRRDEAGTMLAMISTTRCSPKMLPNRRSVSDSTRDRWLINSIGSISGAIAFGTPGGKAKWSRYDPEPLRPDALPVVVEPHRDGAAERAR